MKFAMMWANGGKNAREPFAPGLVFANRFFANCSKDYPAVAIGRDSVANAAVVAGPSDLVDRFSNLVVRGQGSVYAHRTMLVGIDWQDKRFTFAFGFDCGNARPSLHTYGVDSTWASSRLRQSSGQRRTSVRIRSMTLTLASACHSHRVRP